MPRTRLFILTTIFILLCLLIFSIQVQALLLQTRGKITLLRVHELGSRFAPPEDQIDVEVVFQLNTKPNQSVGFQLRNDVWNAI